MIAASATTLLAAIGTSRLLARVSPARAIPPAMGLSAVLFGVEWLWLQRDPGPATVAVYLHLSALSLVLFSGFWSLVNERFDPYTAKGVVARAGGFGALGGALGGLAALVVAPRVGVQALLPTFALLHTVCGVAVLALGRPVARVSAGQEEGEAGAQSGLRSVLGSRFLLQMAGLVILVQGTEQFLDYAFKAAADVALTDEASLVQFFAFFYTASNLVAFGLQTGIGPRALAKLGIGGTLAVLPAAIMLTAATGAAFQRLWTVALARAAQSVVSVSFFKAGFELLWTPVPLEAKRPAKVYVDVGANALGEMVGAGLVLALVSLVVGVPGWVFWPWPPWRRWAPC